MVAPDAGLPDASAGTTGMPDAGVEEASVEVVVDAGSDAPPDVVEEPAPPVCRTDVKLCDNFESGKLDGKWDKLLSASSLLEVDTTHARSGKYALHARITKDTEAYAYAVTESIFPLNPIYLRFYAFIPVENPKFLFSFATAYDKRRGGGGFVLKRNEDQTLGHASFGTMWEIVFGDDPLRVAPPGRWLCVEWKLARPSPEDGEGEGRIWLEDRELTNAFLPYLDADPYSGVGLGFPLTESFQGVPQLDIWYDDVIIDDHRVGCTK